MSTKTEQGPNGSIGDMSLERRQQIFVKPGLKRIGRDESGKAIIEFHVPTGRFYQTFAIEAPNTAGAFDFGSEVKSLSEGPGALQNGQPFGVDEKYFDFSGVRHVLAEYAQINDALYKNQVSRSLVEHTELAEVVQIPTGFNGINEPVQALGHSAIVEISSQIG
jgi:hypothetical protein